jgi:guanylate kinase
MAITIEKEELEKRLIELSETEPQYISNLFRILKERFEVKQISEIDKLINDDFAEYESVFKALA